MIEHYAGSFRSQYEHSEDWLRRIGHDIETFERGERVLSLRTAAASCAEEFAR
jgi:hypothetical protein